MSGGEQRTAILPTTPIFVTPTNGAWTRSVVFPVLFIARFLSTKPNQTKPNPLPEMYSCCTQKSAPKILDKLVSDESNNEARGVKLRYLSGLRPFSNIHFNFKFHCSHLIFYVTLTFFLLVRSWLDRERGLVVDLMPIYGSEGGSADRKV